MGRAIILFHNRIDSKEQKGLLFPFSKHKGEVFYFLTLWLVVAIRLSFFSNIYNG